MLIEIEDDFDLQKIALSGQCFRVRQFNDGTYRFIIGDFFVYIKDMGNQLFSVSNDLDGWNHVWRRYFDFDRCYRDIFDKELINIPLLMKQCNLAEVFVFFG